MENWKAIVYLLAFGQGIVLSLSLIVRGITQQRANLFLGLILYILALEILNAWGMQVHYHSRPDSFPFWNLQSYLVLPVSLWFFVQYTTVPDYSAPRWPWLLFAPSLFEILVQTTWRLYWRHIDQRVPSLLDNPAWFFVTEILPILGMFTVLGFYGWKLFRFRQEWFGRGERLSVYQVIGIYGLFAFLTTLTMLWAAGVWFNLRVFSMIEILLTACLFAFGYAGYVNPDFYKLPILPKPKSPEKPTFAYYDDARELNRLEAAFRGNALYTQSKLTLEEVAGKLHLPPRYISYLINTHHGSNFNHYVNAFRVEEVIRKLGDPREQHKILLALALEAGFSSKSTFNQVFRQHTGKAPSEYLLVNK
ncbi:helix-turn-helix domain-containing protein [Dyadobacter crusticola]|uniref:helix-turn-helix domain-containing protein n=1 Tax=Dyadobacter crusticola TaxID=292407 RepID=UPI000A0564F2|nr:helix-turn-helix domain-containing protein [Dyadobacter crusticola]